MNEHPFQRFINLVSFDQKLQSIENKKVAIDNQITSLINEEKSLTQDLEILKKNLVQLKKEVDIQELEMRTLDEKERVKKQQLERLSDYKEYQAIKGELESIQQLQLEQEKYILHAWDALEVAQGTMEKKTIGLNEQINTLHEKMKDLGLARIALDEECSQLIAERSEKEQHVPKEWLEKYTIMRARVSNPVVEIIQQSCAACSQMLTYQNIAQARKASLIQCQKCFRLLYSAEAMERNVS